MPRGFVRRLNCGRHSIHSILLDPFNCAAHSLQSGVTLDPPFNGISEADVVDAEQLETLQMRSCGLQLRRSDIARTATALHMGFKWARCQLPARGLLVRE